MGARLFQRGKGVWKVCEKQSRPIFADTHMFVVLYQKKENITIQAKKYKHAFFFNEKESHENKHKNMGVNGMNLKKLSMGILILGMLALTVEVAHAQFNVYLKIKGVSGESRVDSRSTDWTQIGGMPHPSRIASGAAGSRGGNAGKVELSDFSIVKNVDKASPKLNLKCTSGEHIPEVTLELRRAGGDKKTFLKIKMTDVKIASIRPEGSGGKKERVTFQYKTLKWERVSLIKRKSRVIKK